MATHTASKTKAVYEFNKADPTYRAEPREDGGIIVYLKGAWIVVNEYETFEEFALWAFEGGDSV